MSTDIKKTHLTADPTLSSIPKAETTPNTVKSEKTPADSFQKPASTAKLKTYTAPLMTGAYNVLGNVDGPSFPKNLLDIHKAHSNYLNLLGDILGLGDLEECFEKIKRELEEEIQRDDKDGQKNSKQESEDETEEETEEQKK